MGFWFCVSRYGLPFLSLGKRPSNIQRRYFKSRFHRFDAAVIVTGFVVDVVLRGVTEKVASLVVILRLWRIFKIVEEFSAGAEQQMDSMNERIDELERENGRLKQELVTLTQSSCV